MENKNNLIGKPQPSNLVHSYEGNKDETLNHLPLLLQMGGKLHPEQGNLWLVASKRDLIANLNYLLTSYNQ